MGNGVGAPFSTTPQAGAPTPILDALLMKRFDGYVVADGLDEVVVVWRRPTKCEKGDLVLVKINYSLALLRSKRLFSSLPPSPERK